MRAGFLVACVVSTSLLVPIHAVSAGGAATVTYDLVSVNGGGQLENGSTFAVSALSFVADTASRHISVQNGSLVVDGLATDCTVDSVAPDCSQVTLLCEDVTHDVIPGVRGGSPGSLDGSPVVTGSIRLFCKHSPALSR